MYKINEATKAEFWELLSAQPRPRMLTDKRMAKLKTIVWDDDYFWGDIVVRHGGLEFPAQAIEDNNPAVWEHCVGNFHGMLMAILHETAS